MTDVDVEVVERAQAKWDRLGVKWQNEFLLVPSDPSQGSWLQVQGKPWGVGCQACHAAGHATSFATFNVRTEAGLQRSNFKSHAANKHHQAAVAQTLAGKTTIVSERLAPSEAEFENLLQNIRNVHSDRKGAQMTWCVAEAMKSLDQTFYPFPLS